MREIIYHVATTLDGFIAHPDGTTDGFLGEGEHVEDYLRSLKDYDTVIMGRNTYEYGYNYGLKPGEPAYPHMEHYIFSKNLHFPYEHEQVRVVSCNELEVLKELKASAGSPIYLCGGGNFAGFLLKHRLIDVLRIKLNPVYFGSGIGLFGSCPEKVALHPTGHIAYNSGVHLLDYRLEYS